MVSNINPANLKLLAIFDAIMRERSVTLAARSLGMSQPATSNALNRLRDVLNDPLFIRTENGMIPTPRALDLAGPIAEGLMRIDEALSLRPFSPAQANRSFNFAVSNPAEVVLMPHLLAHFAKIAPGIRINVLPKWNTTVEEQLESGAIDFAAGIMPSLSARVSTLTLYEDEYVCLRGRHASSGQPITREEFLASEHLAVRPFLNRESQIDQTLEAIGTPRRAVLNVAQFATVPSILARTKLVACILRSVTRQLNLRNCVVDPLPFDMAPMPVILAWDPGRGQSAAMRWMVDQIHDACLSLRHSRG